MIKIKSIGDILNAKDDELFEVLASDEVIGGDDFRRIALAQLTRRIRNEEYLRGMEIATETINVIAARIKEISEMK